MTNPTCCEQALLNSLPLSNDQLKRGGSAIRDDIEKKQIDLGNENELLANMEQRLSCAKGKREELQPGVQTSSTNIIVLYMLTCHMHSICAILH